MTLQHLQHAGCCLSANSVEAGCKPGKLRSAKVQLTLGCMRGGGGGRGRGAVLKLGLSWRWVKFSCMVCLNMQVLKADTKP